MTARRQKEKQRRRARKLAEQAWESAQADNLDLAVKIMRRAVETQIDNPVLWNDLGALLVRSGQEAEAEKAFRSALSLAPDYSEPCSHLAALRVRQGRIESAIALQTRAVHHAPDSIRDAERLATYQALAEAQPEAPMPANSQDTGGIEETMSAPSADWPERLADLDWHSLGKRLTREGCLLLASLVDADDCAQARSWFDEDERFGQTVEMDRPDYGRGTYRYFRPPLPPLVGGLRRAFYPHVARIANDWQELLGEPADFPLDWEEYREVCRSAGQSASTPILLRYEAGGFNALHRDLRGAVFFPIQLAVVLSPRAEAGDDTGFEGGDFLLSDVPEGPKAQRRELRAGLGDAILFCTRDRLEQVGGTWGLRPVMHGVSPITAGTRTVLGIPFHEYR
jgi:hypothetical protein